MLLMAMLNLIGAAIYVYRVFIPSGVFPPFTKRQIDTGTMVSY